MFLGYSGQEARDILENDQGDIKGVTQPNESSTLVRRINIKCTCRRFRLVRHNTYSPSTQTRKAHNDILSELSMDLI